MVKVSSALHLLLGCSYRVDTSLSSRWFLANNFQPVVTLGRKTTLQSDWPMFSARFLFGDISFLIYRNMWALERPSVAVVMAFAGRTNFTVLFFFRHRMETVSLAQLLPR